MLTERQILVKSSSESDVQNLRQYFSIWRAKCRRRENFGLGFLSAVGYTEAQILLKKVQTVDQWDGFRRSWVEICVTVFLESN